MDLDFPTDQHRRFLENAEMGVLLGSFDMQGEIRVHYDYKNRTISLERNDQLACADIEAKVQFNRVERGGWEQFFLISESEYRNILFILQNSWIVSSSEAVVTNDKISFCPPFSINFGNEKFVDLRFNKLFFNDFPYRLIVLDKGWSIDEICLFRPLVFSAAFKNEFVLEQLYICLSSLHEFGNYAGHVHVITDQTRETLLQKVPLLDEARTTVDPLFPTDFVGYVASKYQILDWPLARNYQPLLFVDPDIVFDRDIGPMMHRIAISHKICAPMEVFSPLRTSPSVGASLIQQDGLEPRWSLGFNAGTLGIPNIAEHRKSLETIREIIRNRAHLFKRGEFEWIDQEVANYVSFKTEHFDTSSITKFANLTLDQNPSPLGLVHFWPPRKPKSKRDAMVEYIALLRSNR
ncbi:hypothetical protein AiwAL_14630 [Acidiphilium sp. AL]|uniref:hypothetical protein n=1 Tax=Acidiphilium sp. AL TaxID=2871704 RepID=UPI0021CAF0FB|nr:hypothetical protein [Acidiphilium sp. AL]MCU4161322.1 hypothetical protein [Acidiphilium sp. AL]